MLDGVSFRIEPGESVAISGPSGGGKTTLINILLGILAPTDGEVLIDGVPARGAGAACLRRIAGMVLQVDVLFAGSIGENISVFDPQHDADRASRCAEIAAVHDDICAMPMGYNTLVGDRAIATLAMIRVIVAHRRDTIAAAGREISLVAGKVASDSGKPRPASRTRRRAEPLASPAYD